MDKFAFVVHPINIKQLKEVLPATKWLPDFLIRGSLKFVKPFVVSHIKNVRSITGKEVEGYFIACPLLPQQMLKSEKAFVEERIIRAGRIGQDLGAKIVGLGGYTSVIGDKGITISKSLDIAVTTGNSYTAASVIESVLKASQILKIDLKKARAAIIGATGSIGNVCTRILAGYVPEIIITARHFEKLQVLKNTIENNHSVKVKIENNVHAAIQDADIIIATTSAPEALIDAKELKSGAVACDVSVPKNISGRNCGRTDILVVDGGLIRIPGKIDFGTPTELPDDLIYACMAETMILALEGRFECFSLGNDLQVKRINEISRLAEKHGFRIAEIEPR
ncbi:MAG: shikimate dehydrogenase [Candidatus Omnitrophica bacterium]|nr:shikimate dehydrogenase [Candidatus Omnitrophota bacterium]